jgi:hypothetical protein
MIDRVASVTIRGQSLGHPRMPSEIPTRTIEHMSDAPPPRVHVTLPGGRRVEARLLRWRQQDGAWQAEVALTIPAAAVQQVAGEDYSQVPRVPAPPSYVLATDTRLTPPTGEVHRADCWCIAQPAAWRRVIPFLDGVTPDAMARWPDTTLCGVCRPEGWRG